ncbi:MAG: hypothetical protein AAFQ80_25475 [Cyanobacteria bacterium J06621_8]
MTMDGATLYYKSKKSFSFERVIFLMEELGLSCRHPETNLITGINGDLQEFSEASLKQVRNLIYQAQHSGIHFWFETLECLFGSFVEQGHYFFQHFSFSYFDSNSIEQKISHLFLKLALHELAEVEGEILGFTLNQFGQNEEYDFGKIFQPDNKEILSHHYISDITFLPRKKLKKLALGNESEIIRINQRFDCIAKNQELGRYLKSLL